MPFGMRKSAPILRLCGQFIGTEMSQSQISNWISLHKIITIKSKSYHENRATKTIQP